MQKENSDIFSWIREINALWKDVYPHLARHIIELYGRSNGAVLEVGPFCGVVYELNRQCVGDFFYIASFPEQMREYYTDQAEREGLTDSITVIETSPHLKEFGDNSIDLLIFRGALFFPSLFTIDYRAIERVLKPSGTAFVGGGFGKYTPPDVISPIADISRKLNLLIGKKEITTDMIKKDLRDKDIMDHSVITTDGGLWIVIQKGDKLEDHQERDR